MQSGWEIFTSTSVSYVTVDFRKVVNDLSPANSTLLENKCIKRKIDYDDIFMFQM